MDKKIIHNAIKSLKRLRFKLAKTILAVYFNQRIKHHKTKMLFIIGHMRSGSTLLLHILNTNKNIIGYGETHRSYHLLKDFGKVASHIFLKFKRVPHNESYVLDKVLHNEHFQVEDSDLIKDQKVLFQIREPKGALSSIYDMYHKDRFNYINNKEIETLKHYKERLISIQKFAKKLPLENWEMVTYSDLLRNSTGVFHRLERFLGLEDNLTEDYDSMDTTGMHGIGDTSDNIKAGKIRKNKPRAINPELEPYLDEANFYFRQCVRTLTSLKEGKKVSDKLRDFKPKLTEEKSHKELSLHL